MKFLISMNYKMFNKLSPKELIDKILYLDTNKNIDGAEIYINLSKAKERAYCTQLVRLLKKKGWIVQIHSVNLNNLSSNKIDKYLSYYNNLALIYGKKIKLTIHPADDANIQDVINKSTKILNYVKNVINDNNYNIEMLLENLNELNERIKCDINNVVYILKKTNLDGITLDLGHYVCNNLNDFSKISYIDKIKNIHIHDIYNKNDHYPFYYHNVKLDKISKYLKETKYNQSIVLEYALEYLKGITFEEKLTEYINQAEYVKKCLIGGN